MLRDGFSVANICELTHLNCILMFRSIHVFRPEGPIWDPVWEDIKIYVRFY